jgi:hypothetical protein
MRNRSTKTALITSFLACNLIFGAAPLVSAPVTFDEAREIATEAYIYAYPMMMTELTRRFAMSAPTGAMNRINHRRAFPDPRSTAVVRPNADTLYSVVWFDVSTEPQVFSIPDSGGRYYMLQFMDLWTDTFATPGTRTTGNRAQTIVLADAQWNGAVPTGAMLIRSPTSMGWMIGRWQTNGVDDYSNVHKVQDGMALKPLSVHGKQQGTYEPPKTPIDSSWELSAPPVVLIEKLGAQKYFEMFAELMKKNPPHSNDYPIVHRMARINIQPGESFSFANASAELKRALEASVVTGLKSIKGGWGGVGSARNGWRVAMTAIGTYGTDYRARASTAYGGLGANPIEDALYPGALKDTDGKPFSSDNRYVLHFTKEQIPPVRAFWSLTMYDERQLFTANLINRYAIGDRDKLRFNADGSLDLYIQRVSPGSANESNWLPAPAQGEFTMTLRLYWPKAEALDGTWAPPVVQQAR